MFLADENIYPKVVTFLRDLGYSVVDLREESLTSLSDEKVMEFAKEVSSLFWRKQAFA